MALRLVFGDVGGGSEWWTESHDECHTNRYGADCRPPAAPQDLEFDGDALTFTAPGDDWLAGQVTAYELRVADEPIDSFADWEKARPTDDAAPRSAATAVTATPAGPSGAAERLDLPAGTVAVGIVAVDDVGDRSQMAAIARGPSRRPAPVPPAPAPPAPSAGATDRLPATGGTPWPPPCSSSHSSS